MTPIQIALILISGLGALHGLFLAFLLWTQAKKNISDQILATLLLILSFRIAKSVFLEFTENLDIKLIFIGLASMMAIGPLFYLYTLSRINKGFRFLKKTLTHFIPFVIGLCFGLWVNQEGFSLLPKGLLLFLFACYYGHYLTYLIISYKHISKLKTSESHASNYALLRLVFYGLLSIWIVYVLNLFDEFIPYIVGPILYTLIAYSISFIVIRRGYLNSEKEEKYKTISISQEKIKKIFNKVNKVIEHNEEYKNPELTLRLLSDKLNLSTQIISMVINKESNSNFNSFINHFRVKETIRMFKLPKYDNQTIASIAFESGFNSITSFNSAFKKQTGKTPLAFRKELTK